MAIALWIIVAVAYCVFVRLCLGKAARRSRNTSSSDSGAWSFAQCGEGVKRMFSFRLCVVFFLVLATFMWLPPALHAGVTAAIILLVLIVPIAHRWFTHRVR
jgi:hypothetical protein